MEFPFTLRLIFLGDMYDAFYGATFVAGLVYEEPSQEAPHAEMCICHETQTATFEGVSVRRLAEYTAVFKNACIPSRNGSMYTYATVQCMHIPYMCSYHT